MVHMHELARPLMYQTLMLWKFQLSCPLTHCFVSQSASTSSAASLDKSLQLVMHSVPCVTMFSHR